MQGFGDVDDLGNPYGFTPTPLQQHTPSFPVLVTSQMSRPRSVQQLILLSDGHYLSSSTASLSLRLVTYNSDAHALTYSKARFDWQEAGVITAAPPFILSLPVLAYASYSASRFVLQCSWYESFQCRPETHEQHTSLSCSMTCFEIL